MVSCSFTTSLISNNKKNSYVTSASDSWVNYFSYEEGTVCISIKNQHEEGMVEFNGRRKRHGHYFSSSCCCRLSTSLINIQSSLMDNLGKKKKKKNTKSFWAENSHLRGEPDPV